MIKSVLNSSKSSCSRTKAGEQCLIAILPCKPVKVSGGYLTEALSPAARVSEDGIIPGQKAIFKEARFGVKDLHDPSCVPPAVVVLSLSSSQGK